MQGKWREDVSRYVWWEACRPKLDKTGITLIDKIIMATALLAAASLLPFYSFICTYFGLTCTLKIFTQQCRCFVCVFVLKKTQYPDHFCNLSNFAGHFLACVGPLENNNKSRLLLRSVCLGFISIKRQATLPNHDKGELVSRPPPLPLSIHLFIPALAPSSAHSGMQVC